MGQVAITVNGRSYRFDCGDGEEARLKELAAYVKGRVEALTREHGNVGEERLLLMAALLITDELWDARAALAETPAAPSRAKEPAPKPPRSPSQRTERREQASAIRPSTDAESDAPSRRR